MDIGKMIKTARLERGMTQKDLAAAIGCSMISIQQYELGRRVPRTDIMNRLANYLQLKLNCEDIPKEVSDSSRRLAAYGARMTELQVAQLVKNEDILVLAEPEYTRKEIEEIQRYAGYLKWKREQKGKKSEKS